MDPGTNVAWQVTISSTVVVAAAVTVFQTVKVDVDVDRTVIRVLYSCLWCKIVRNVYLTK
jgi:hypothetical protein